VAHQPAVIRVVEMNDDDLVSKGDSDPLDLDRTKVFVPRHVARRVTAQGGLFTAHSTGRGEFRPLERDPAWRDRTWTIKVAPRQFVHIRGELNRWSVNQATLFGDLSALCGHLEWQSSVGLDEG
jgi:hypothetical protein